MVTVEQAEQIINSQMRDYGNELVPFANSLGRVLAEDLLADRDFPPSNRSTMDGIGISYSALIGGQKAFTIIATIAAGNQPVEISRPNECVEIMTGAPIPDSVDTVIRYEDVEIEAGVATVLVENIKQGQNIHNRGKDKRSGDRVALAGQVITPSLVGVAASVGKTHLLVKKQPRIVVISTGDELVGVEEIPTLYQIRRSNSHTIKAVLEQFKIEVELIHIIDNQSIIQEKIRNCLSNYDVLLLSGGVSMGKFDFIPAALKEAGVECLFHKIQQKPGKPFWFGTHDDGQLVFAFPGNPVSTFLCLHRYFLPWLQIIRMGNNVPVVKAKLGREVTFIPNMQYFLQVKVEDNEEGQLIATPLEGNGSGDFANLLESNAFMELPKEQTIFIKGEVYRIWPFKLII